MKARNKEKIEYMPYLTDEDYRHCRHKNPSNCNSREYKEQIISY